MGSSSKEFLAKTLKVDRVVFFSFSNTPSFGVREDLTVITFENNPLISLGGITGENSRLRGCVVVVRVVWHLFADGSDLVSVRCC